MRLLLVSFIIFLTNISYASFNLAHHEEICDSGGFESCNLLGYSYSIGANVNQDYSKSYEYYKISCDGGNGNGCFGLGLLYYTGADTKADPSKAKILFYKACDFGHKVSCDWYKEFDIKGY